MTKSLLGKRYENFGKVHNYIKTERLQARSHILDNIIPNIKYEEIPCPCGSTDDSCLATIDRFGLPIQAVLCNQCGLIRLASRWNEETYIRIYKEAFWPLQSGSNELDENRFLLSVKRAQPFADKLRSLIELQDKDVLEIGCSYGAGLFKIKEFCGDVTGYDYDEKFLSKGIGYSGLDLRSGGLEQAIEDGKQYDVVILRHVLEHFLDPIGSLHSIRKLVAEDGVLFVEVPGVLGVNQWLQDPLLMFNVFHTYYFSMETLTQAMAKAGFNLLNGDEHIFSTWSVGDNNINAISHSPDHANRILSDIKRAERTRQRDSLFNMMWTGVDRLKKIMRR